MTDLCAPSTHEYPGEDSTAHLGNGLPKCKSRSGRSRSSTPMELILPNLQGVCTERGEGCTPWGRTHLVEQGLGHQGISVWR